MKKNIFFLLITCFLLGLNYSCKKDDKTTVKDCETKNYGTVTINFGSTTVVHSILITLGNSSAREKLSSLGKSSDTIHLPPGFYPTSIASVNNLGQAINQTSKNFAVTQCSEETATVPF
jgi:hypothetical protein